MKILKTIILLISIFSLGVTTYGLFLPKKQIKNSNIEINVSDSVVYNALVDIRAWEHWDNWLRSDSSTLRFTYSINTVGNGATRSWDHPIYGKGTMTLSDCVRYSNIHTIMRMSDKKEVIGNIRLEKNRTNTTTLVKMDQRLELGWNPYMRIMGNALGRLIDSDQKEWLANLKKHLESKN